MLKVILALENQFGIKVEGYTNYTNKHFTGSFNNANEELALKTVFDAMSISYSVHGKTVKLK